jgi:hypothetical protein
MLSSFDLRVSLLRSTRTKRITPSTAASGQRAVSMRNAELAMTNALRTRPLPPQTPARHHQCGVVCVATPGDRQHSITGNRSCAQAVAAKTTSGGGSCRSPGPVADSAPKPAACVGLVGNSMFAMLNWPIKSFGELAGNEEWRKETRTSPRETSGSKS